MAPAKSDKPDSPEALRALVAQRGSELTPRMRDAAHYALEHPGDVALCSLAELGDLADRLSEIQQSGVVTAGGGQRPDPTTAFERLINEADRQLDDLAVYRQARAAH